MVRLYVGALMQKIEDVEKAIKQLRNFGFFDGQERGGAAFAGWLVVAKDTTRTRARRHVPNYVLRR
jgi:hypothetical protein